MFNWLLRFLVCALVILVVIYVTNLLLAEIVLPGSMRVIVLLIIAVVCIIAVVRYLGWPPVSGGPPLA